MNEVKHQRFVRVMTRRVNKILDDISSLGKCADRRSYDYTTDMVDTSFSQILQRLTETRAVFDTDRGRKRFSLSNAGWYWISGDDGNTWTKQTLTTDEVSRHISEGYMLKKTQPLASPPHIKIVAVYDYKHCDFTVYSTSPNVECDTLDTGAADPVDPDYADHVEEMEKTIHDLDVAVEKNELFIVK